MVSRGQINDAVRAALRSAWTRFTLAVLGVVLVAITPNPPETLLHWVQTIVGASLTAYVTVAPAPPDEIGIARVRGQYANDIRVIGDRKRTEKAEILTQQRIAIEIETAVSRRRQIP